MKNKRYHHVSKLKKFHKDSNVNSSDRQFLAKRIYSILLIFVRVRNKNMLKKFPLGTCLAVIHQS